MTASENNPKNAALTYAATLEGSPLEKAKKLEEYDSGLEEARKVIALLRQSYRMQAAAFGHVSSERESSADPLAKFLSRTPKPSIQRAILAYILFQHAANAAEIVAGLQGREFVFGQGQPGDLIRSGLWHLNKKKKLLRKLNDGRYGFRFPEVGVAFADREGLPMP